VEPEGVITKYLELGLRIGRHIEGFVDAYYGPAALSDQIGAETISSPEELRTQARRLIAAIDAREPLDRTDSGTSSDDEGTRRRAYLRAQVVGMEMSARVLGGETVGYADEVEACYGVRPTRVDNEVILGAHRDLDAVVPGSGPLAERLIAWREAQAIEPDKLEPAVRSLTEDLRARTIELFGLPEGENVSFEFVTNQPWSGFNYYLGNLSSRVAINIDLPVLSTSLAHLVAHEAYPGHHTEHTRKEVGLVRNRHFLEESIFLVGTPQCLLAEGLADLGLEVLLGRRPESLIAEHFAPLGISYDTEVVAVVSEAGRALGAVRSNAAFRLHEDGADPEVVIDEMAYFGLLPRNRAEKSVEFLLDPTWRTYISCYVEGLPLCRNYVNGDPRRFERLITDQIIPADLLSA
jgi:hypothetical protein